MASELEGKPLKFTALFDSKDAEMQMSAFLKKVQDINTKGVSNNANKAVNKASSQYASILGDVTQSFNDFVKSNDRFYAGIAQSEMGLQKVRNEQSSLNAELKKGLVTEEEYINKTAELAKLREKLSQNLRDNKAQLQQYNSVAKAKPKFTKQDTLNELASAHGANTVAIPNISAREAYEKQFQQNISLLNKEYSELEKRLKEGIITNEEYAKSASEINAKLIQLRDEQKHFNKNVGEDISSDNLKKQKEAIDVVSNQYKALVSDATSAFQSISPEAQNLNNKLTSLGQESKDLASAQKELDAAFRAGDITQKQYLNASRDLGVQQNVVKQRIAETRKEINQIDQSERRTIGSIAEKTAKLTQLKQRYDQLSESQRNNINIGGRLRREYQQLTAEVNKLNTSLAGTKSGGIESVFTSIRGIAAAAGITFSVQQLVSFGKELFDIAKQAEGIELRFAKIGDTTGLEKLRAATRNTVSDLELMKLAVNADNFRIPMDVLAKGLEFATRRATETGQSVDYLVNSFVTGLGRKSKLILDNLGISATELNEEIQKTGDFATGVGNIIDREMRKSGDAVDGLSEKTDRLNSKWENLKKTVAQAFISFFDPGRIETNNVEQLTEGYKKSFDSIKGFSNDAKQLFIKNSQEQLDAVNQQLKALSIDNNQEFQQLLKERNKNKSVYKFETPETAFDILMRKPLIEQQQALQASLSYARGITAEMAIQERQSKNIFSQTELEEKLSDAQNLYKNAIGDKARAEAKKEVDKWQKLLDGVSMKSLSSASKKGESEAKRLAKEIAKDNEDRTKLLDQWAKTDADYLNKQLSRDQQEIQSVKDKYKEIRKTIEKHNKETKGDTISLDGFDESVSSAIKAVRNRQANDLQLKRYQEDYQNYLEYEQLKRSQGGATANELLGKYQGVVEKMKIEYAALTAKSAIGMISPTDELYRNQLGTQLKEESKRRSKQDNDDYVAAIELAETIGQAELKIRQKYTDAYSKLEKDASDEQKENLKRLYLEDLESLVENSPKFKQAIDNIDKSSEAMLGNAFRRGKEVIIELIDGLESSTDEQKSALKKIFSRFFDRGAIDADLGNWDAISAAAQDFQQLVSASFDFASNTDNALQSLTAMISVSSNIARTLGKLFENDSLQNISSKLGLFAPLLSVGGAISNFFDHRREANNQRVQDQIDLNNERQLRSTEAVTKMLEAQLNLINEIYGDKRLEEYNKSLGEIATNYSNINKQLDGMFKMTGDAFTDNILERLNRGESKKEIQNSFQKFSAEWYRASDVLSDKNLNRMDRFTALSNDIEEARQALIKLSAEAALSGDSKTQELISQLETQIDLYERTMNKLREENTGSAFSSILNDVKSLFLNSGENAADAWSKGFDKIMENYMMQKFSRDWLEEKMQVFYEEFDKMAESGGEITDKERDELKRRWDEIQAEGEKRVQGLRDTLKLEDGSSSLKSESIARQLTETTGSEIVGMYRAGYDIWKQQLNIMQSQAAVQNNILVSANERLTALNAIEINTFQTVQRLDLAIDQLKAVNKNLGGKYV